MPTSTATAAPELGPEELATSVEQVAGKWKTKLMGGGAGDTAILDLSPEGTWEFRAVSGEHDGMQVGAGTFRFEGDTLLLESEQCLKYGPTDEFFFGTARYSVFVAMADGRPARIHFIAIEDDWYDRKLTMDGKMFPAYLEP